MSALNELPACRVWHMERLLPEGARATMMEGRQETGEEMALVVGCTEGLWQDQRLRGIATLRADDAAPVIEWGSTDQQVRAAFSRGLRRLGWTGAPTLCEAIWNGRS